MAEALAFASSIIAVISFTGQVIQGCQNINAFIDELRNSPGNIQNLLQELDFV
ncbi:hypothetical protein F5884DRAFT_789389, partial [Xylogone sp. PMI_703]